MQSSNPVFRRSEGFNGQGSRTAAGNGFTYPAPGAPRRPAPGTTDTASWRSGSSPDQFTTPGQVAQGPMTIDSVVQKTAMTMGVVVLFAAATWILTGDLAGSAGAEVASRLYVLSMVGALGGFALAMVNSFKRVVSPALVLAYAALQGVFVGAFSKVIEGAFGDPSNPGLVIGAVIGTMAAVFGTLAAYKFFDIKVGQRFRTWVVAAMFGFVAVALLDFVLALFGTGFGFNGFGTLGLVTSLIGLGLGVLMLILDFDFVERGIAARLPERESWRAAFGLAVTIVWIYIELLRILAILRGGD